MATSRLSVLTPQLMLIRVKNALAKIHTNNMQGLKNILKKYTEECNRLNYVGFHEEERQSIIDHMDLAYILVVMEVYSEIEGELQACKDILSKIILEDKMLLKRLRDKKSDTAMIGSLAYLPDDILDDIRKHVELLPRPVTC